LANLTYNDKLVLVQHAITKFDSEPLLKEKLKGVMSEKDIERSLDTLIATQKVRRIGNEKIQNNISAMGELPPLSTTLATIFDGL
jgi:hypothetical protein